MKTRYLFITLALVGALCACTREEESFFDQSAAERSQAALENAQEVLVAPENGWEMLYYANTGSRGYNILVKFESNGRIYATAKNAATTKNKLLTDSLSTWHVVLDYGPILSFDTYNDVLHAWADPKTDGDGLLGDYEFLILHADENYVKLKGKKHSSYNYLYPLKEAVEPAAYFKAVEDMQSALFKNNNLLTWVCDGKEFLLHNGNSGIFSLTEQGQAVNAEEDDIYPFATNREGIQLSYPILSNKDVFFRLEGDKLVGETSSISVGKLNVYFYNYVILTQGGWTLDIKKDISDSLKTIITAASAEIKTKYKNERKGGITAMRFQRAATTEDFLLAFSYIGSGSKASTFYYRFNAECTGDLVKLTYVEPQDENAGKVLAALPATKAMIEGLTGEYEISTEHSLNPTIGIKLSSHSDSDFWFTTTGTVE